MTAAGDAPKRDASSREPSRQDSARKGGDELRRALAPLAGDPIQDAQEVLARLREEEQIPSRRRPGPSRRVGQRDRAPLLHWARQVAWPAAWAAAGFLFGLLYLNSQQDEGFLETEMPSGPHMVLARGQVFLDQDRNRQLLPVGAPIPEGSSVETSDQGTCVVSLRDGSVLLLDKNTRIRLLGTSEVDLEIGRILARIHKSDGQSDLIVTGKGSAATRLLQSDKQPWGETLFSKRGDRYEILSMKGLASVRSQAGETLRLGPRRDVVLRSGKEEENQVLPYLSHRLAWADDYLAFLPKPEWQIQLEKQLPGLLDQLGKEETWMEVDLKIRHIGPAAIDPLFSVIEKYKGTEDPGEIQKRLHAAGLVSNMASLRDVDRLFHYLMDDSPRVRISMFYGLERLIGSFYSETSEKALIWTEGSQEERKKELQKWKAWWDKRD